MVQVALSNKTNPYKEVSMQTLRNVGVERVDPKTLRIKWDPPTSDPQVLIYVGESPDAIETTQPTAQISGQNYIDLPDLNPAIRYYFRLVPDEGPEINVAERRVPMEGTLNFRDLGGYRTTDGRHVKWGRIFRSDGLARLTDPDQTLLKQIGIKLVCDFRAPAEVEKSPNKLPPGGAIQTQGLPVVSHEFDTVAIMERIKKGDTDWINESLMVDGYIRNIESFPDIWGTVINNLIDPQKRPLVFHCTAGKDRTGVCAALILWALGVSEEVVIEDHQLSNIFLAPFLPKMTKYLQPYGVDVEDVMPYLVAPRAAIVAVIERIRTNYGTVDRYLNSKSGVNLKTLALIKKEFLES